MQRQNGDRLAAVYRDATAPRLLKALNRKTPIGWGDLPGVVGGEWDDVLRSVALLSGADLCEASTTGLRLSVSTGKGCSPMAQSSPYRMPRATPRFRETSDEAREEGNSATVQCGARKRGAPVEGNVPDLPSPVRGLSHAGRRGRHRRPKPGLRPHVVRLGWGRTLPRQRGRQHRRARYSTTQTLPDGFVREALVELAQDDLTQSPPAIVGPWEDLGRGVFSSRNASRARSRTPHHVFLTEPGQPNRELSRRSRP